MTLRYWCYSNHITIVNIHFDIDLLLLQCGMTYILHIYLHTTYISTHVHIHIHIISHILKHSCLCYHLLMKIVLRVSVSTTDPFWTSHNVLVHWINNSKELKHNNQSFNKLMATNKSGYCKHLDVDCNQSLTWHLDPLIPPPYKQIPEIPLNNWWAIYIIISGTHLYCSRSNFWSDPIDSAHD